MSKKKAIKSVYIGEKSKSLFTEQFDRFLPSQWNKDIAPYFKRLNKIKDERSFVILASAVLELKVDIFLKLFIPNSQILVNDKTNFDSKIKILRAFNLIPSHIVNIIEVLKNIRNEFAHHISLDSFSEAHLSENLPNRLELLDKYWTEYENDMTYYKIKPVLVQKYKDLWRVSLEALDVYESNIIVLRQELEREEFVEKLKIKAATLKAEKEQEFQKNFLNYFNG